MTVKIQKWGNSLAIRIPSMVAKEAHMREGTSLDVLSDVGSILLRKKTRLPKYSLKELVDKITPENRHGEIDFGSPVGKERFWEAE